MIHIKSKKIAQSQLQKVKKRSDKEYKKEQLYQDTLDLQRQVNRRLKSLSRHYKKRSWATRNLVDRLDKKTIKAFKNDKVSINKNMTITQLNNINKTLRNFLVSKTSTNKGIKEVKKIAVKSLKTTLDVTEEEAELLYGSLQNSSVQYLVDLIGASETWATIEDAKDKDDSETDFQTRIISLINSNDDDVRLIAINIYNKYVI